MSNLRIEYRYQAAAHVRLARTVILENDGGYTPEEIRVLFQLAMRRYQRYATEISFLPRELGWPALTVPDEAPLHEPLHELGGIDLLQALPSVPFPVSDLVARLDAMIEEDRQWRIASR